MPARGAHDLKLAYEKPWGWVLVFPGWDCSLGSTRLMGPVPFRKANPGAQQSEGPRPIGLRALWLIDPKSWVLTISELICFLGSLADETFYEYQA